MVLVGERQKPGVWSALGSLALLCLALGLVFAFADTSVGLLHAPEGLESPANTIVACAAAFSAYLIACFPVLLLASLSRRVRPSLPIFPVVASVGVTLVCTGLLPALLLEPGRGVTPGDLAALGLGLLVAIGIGVALFLLIRGGGVTPQHVQAMAAAAAVAAALSTLGIWLDRFKWDFVWSSALLIATFVISATATTWLLLGTRSRNRVPAASLGLAGCLLLAVPLARFSEPPRAADRSGQEAGPRPGQVILLTVDTLRADVLSAYSDTGEPTPGIGRLARDGVLFERAISPGPWTKPAFASMFTGLSPLVHGANTPHSRLPFEVQTLAERMQEHGYKTAAIGLNPVLGPRLQFDQGFDEYHWFPRPFLGPSLGARLLGLVFMKAHGSYIGSEMLTDIATEWIDRNRDESFFLWVHFYDPHDPFTPPERLLAADHRAGSIGTRFLSAKEVARGTLVPSDAERREIKQLYLAEARFADEQVDRLLDSLERLGLYDASLIVFASDHGEAFWEHDTFGHGQSLHHELLDVPLIFKLPGSKVRGRVPTVVSTGSVAPTVLELCGSLLADDEATYASLLPSIRSAAQPDQTVVSSGLLEKDRISVVFEGFKYIRDESTGGEVLYDLSRDTRETESVDQSAPKVMERARALLNDHKRASEDIRLRIGVPRASAEDPPVLDERQIEELKALGYL